MSSSPYARRRALSLAASLPEVAATSAQRPTPPFQLDKGQTAEAIADFNALNIWLNEQTSDAQECDGTTGRACPFPHLHFRLRHALAGGHTEKLGGAMPSLGRWPIKVIRRSGQASGFNALPCRWTIESTVAAPGQCHRLVKDFETAIASIFAWSFADIRLPTRRAARL
ncbi:MAG: hypothetical protein WA840_08280 [Caulobacteraceae bacterium]